MVKFDRTDDVGRGGFALDLSGIDGLQPLARPDGAAGQQGLRGGLRIPAELVVKRDDALANLRIVIRLQRRQRGLLQSPLREFSSKVSNTEIPAGILTSPRIPMYCARVVSLALSSAIVCSAFATASGFLWRRPSATEPTSNRAIATSSSSGNPVSARPWNAASKPVINAWLSAGEGDRANNFAHVSKSWRVPACA